MNSCLSQVDNEPEVIAHFYMISLSHIHTRTHSLSPSFFALQQSTQEPPWCCPAFCQCWSSLACRCSVNNWGHQSGSPSWEVSSAQSSSSAPSLYPIWSQICQSAFYVLWSCPFLNTCSAFCSTHFAIKKKKILNTFCRHSIIWKTCFLGRDSKPKSSQKVRGTFFSCSKWVIA